MNTTDEQIKTVEALRDRYATIEGSQNHTALTAILADWRESRELLEAAVTIGFQNDFLTRISPETWVRHSDDEASNGVQFNSALDAFAEVKKENR